MKTKLITVRVTKEDIAKGVPGNSDSCPLAIAMTRTFKRPTSVSYCFWWFTGHIDENRYLRLKRRLNKFINRFDSDKPVKPLTFRIKVPV